MAALAEGSRAPRIPQSGQPSPPNPAGLGDVTCSDSDLLLLQLLDGPQHLFLPQTIYLWFPTVKTVVKLPKLYFLRNIWNIYSLLEQDVISSDFSTGSSPAEPPRSPPKQALLPLPSHRSPSLPRALNTTGEKHQGCEEPPVSEHHEHTDCSSAIPTSLLYDPRVYF